MSSRSSNHRTDRRAAGAASDFVERRQPAGAGGPRVWLLRLRGALKRPLRLQRRGDQWHLVLADRRQRPATYLPPTPTALCRELRQRLMAFDHDTTLKAMRHLVRAHDALGRRGWTGLEALPARDLTRAARQLKLLLDLEPSRTLAYLAERLLLARVAAEVREERRDRLQREQLEATRVDVRETDFAEYVRSEFASDTIALDRHDAPAVPSTAPGTARS